MARRAHGFRSKTRKLLRIRGKARRLPPSQKLKFFEVGEPAVIKIAPSVHEGMPHPRYYGKRGTVIEKRGRCYMLEVREGGKSVKLIAAPAHLQKVVQKI